MKLTIGYFYPDLLNLYGDTGNVEILAFRAKKMGFDVEVIHITIGTDMEASGLSDVNLLFMGGGPDSGQKSMYKDLFDTKRNFVEDYVSSGKVGLYICGAYQLLGKYYKSADGSVLDGLGVFDLYTQHFGADSPRCIGNTLAQLSSEIVNDPIFPNTPFNDKLVGFENHGGRTYLGKAAKPFAKVLKGHGNNSTDATEGVLYKNSIGTYFHGPILSKNPHLADYLIFKALNLDKQQIETLPKIDDTLVLAAHTASKKLPLCGLAY